MCADLGDGDRAEELALEALGVSREIESEVGESDALFTLANAAFERGDITRARDCTVACIAACVTVEPTQGIRHTLALIETFLGNLTAAERILDELEKATLDQQMKAYLPRTRGIIAASLGDHASALGHFERGAAACPTHRARIEGLRFVALAHLNLGDLSRARALAAYLHDQTVESDVPGYAARTANILGLIDVREGKPSLGAAAIAASLGGAVSRGNRYRAWSYLHAAAEALDALANQAAALELLRFADQIALEHHYWLPANDWVPLVDRASLERDVATEGAAIESFEMAVETVRRSTGRCAGPVVAGPASRGTVRRRVRGADIRRS